MIISNNAIWFCCKKYHFIINYYTSVFFLIKPMCLMRYYYSIYYSRPRYIPEKDPIKGPNSNQIRTRYGPNEKSKIKKIKISLPVVFRSRLCAGPKIRTCGSEQAPTLHCPQNHDFTHTRLPAII